MGAPVLFQVTPAGKRPVAGRFAIRGPSRVAFEVAAWDRSAPLVIDPTLTWSSYLGGNGDDAAHGIAIDGSGNVYVCGETLSTNFPTTAGSIQPNDLDVAGVDAFVSKINLTGTVRHWVPACRHPEGQLSPSTRRAQTHRLQRQRRRDGDVVTRLSAAGNSVAPANAGYVVQFGELGRGGSTPPSTRASTLATGMTMSANAELRDGQRDPAELRRRLPTPSHEARPRRDHALDVPERPRRQRPDGERRRARPGRERPRRRYHRTA
jgi:hypothetical protein